MRKYGKRGRKFIGFSALFILTVFVLTGCSGSNTGKQAEQQGNGDVPEREGNGQTDPGPVRETGVGIAKESAQDAQIDFAALKEENTDIFAWLYIPDTAIDCPVLQSMQADDFYENHNAYGKEDEAGAVHIKLANLASMCDFNTVLHGGTGEDAAGPFADLYRFADPDFFENHEKLYLYLDGNVLTYEIFAAYERENTNLLSSYDFTYLDGCQQFLDDLYGTREMTMKLREGWEGITPYHFLVTLTTHRQEDADRQFVVLAILTQDAAGTIDRIVAE